MDTHQTPQIPDFAQTPLPNTTPTVSSTSTISSASDGGAAHGSKKKLGLFFAILISVAIPVISYFVYTNTQTVNTDAVGITSCRERPTGSSCAGHGWSDKRCYDRGNAVMVQCRDGSRWCVPDGETFQACGDGCKRINPCQLKCRDDNGLERFVNTCESEPTPTPQISKPPLCPEPSTCVNPDDAVKMGCVDSTASMGGPLRCSFSGSNASGSTEGFCCKPKVTPTEEPTRTPTPSPTLTVTPSPTPSPTPSQCVNPKIDVEVECLTCGNEQ